MMPPPQQAGSSDHFMLGIIQMVQSNTSAMMQMMQAQSAKQTELVVAIMSQGSAAGREHIQTMQKLHDTHSQEQARLMQGLLETARGAPSSGGTGQLDGFMRGLEFAREYATAGGADDEIGEIFSSLAPFLAGAAKSTEDSGNGQPS
jgi:hypothetical protein